MRLFRVNASSGWQLTQTRMQTHINLYVTLVYRAIYMGYVHTLAVEIIRVSLHKKQNMIFSLPNSFNFDLYFLFIPYVIIVPFIIKTVYIVI